MSEPSEAFGIHESLSPANLSHSNVRVASSTIEAGKMNEDIISKDFEKSQHLDSISGIVFDPVNKDLEKVAHDFLDEEELCTDDEDNTDDDSDNDLDLNQENFSLKSSTENIFNNAIKPGNCSHMLDAAPDKKGFASPKYEKNNHKGQLYWFEIGPLEGAGAPRQDSLYAERCGVPCPSPTEDISQSAALPQSSAPVEVPPAQALLPGPAVLPGPGQPAMHGPGQGQGQGHPGQAVRGGIQGARHPSSALKEIPRHKQKIIQQHLILLLHAHKCIRVEVLKIPCPVPYCDVMKMVQKHLKTCRQGDACPAPYCSSSRRIISHWKHCKAPECVVCSKLKNAALKTKRKRPEKVNCNSIDLQPIAIPNMGYALAIRTRPLPMGAPVDNL